MIGAVLDLVGLPIGNEVSDQHRAIIASIRLPRACLALLVGIALAQAGALLQGLFRNPLAEPTLVGVSSGAALAAASVIVFAGAIAGRQAAAFLPFALPVAAFVGGLVATILIYRIGARHGSASIPLMLLAGIAINAIAFALIGVLIYASDDRQLRDITFWMMGSLGGARWLSVAILAPVALVPLLLGGWLARSLNAMILGEREAGHLGIDVERVKRAAIDRHRHHRRRRRRRDRHHRLRRPGRAASGAADDRSRPPHRPAGLRPARRGAAAGRGSRRAHRGGAGRAAGRPGHQPDRRAVLHLAAADARAAERNVIAAENLGVHVAGMRLLRNVAAAVAPGEFVAIIGPNGAGKSTLLRALSGELTATEGRVSLDGVPIERVPRIELARRRAVLPQAVRLAFPMLAEEVVALGRTPHFGTDLMRDDKLAIAAAIGWAGVGHLRSRVYDTLSGGEQQRVNLARVFAQISTRTPGGPRYLLLDEPTAPLDVAQQHHVLRLIRALADNGVGVCAVLHDLNQAALWADRIIAIRDGEGAATGTPEDVITEQTLEAVYAMPFEVLFSRQGQPLAQIRAPARPSAGRPTLQ